MSADLLAIAKRVDEQISAVHAAFGAPGDYGYNTPEGITLFDLYRFQVELRAAIYATMGARAEAVPPRNPNARHPK